MHVINILRELLAIYNDCQQFIPHIVPYINYKLARTSKNQVASIYSNRERFTKNIWRVILI